MKIVVRRQERYYKIGVIPVSMLNTVLKNPRVHFMKKNTRLGNHPED